MVSYLSLSTLDGTKKSVNMVSWFRPLHIWDIEMTIGFMFLWFRGFIVSCTPPLDSKKLIRFVHSISGHRDDDRFHCFMVSSTPSLDGQNSTGFVVSWFHGFAHFISGRREVDSFRGFMVLSTPSLDRSRQIWSGRYHEIAKP